MFNNTNNQNNNTNEDMQFANNIANQQAQQAQMQQAQMQQNNLPNGYQQPMNQVYQQRQSQYSQQSMMPTNATWQPTNIPTSGNVELRSFNDIMRGGAPSFFNKESVEGATITGIVVRTEMSPATEFNNPNKLLRWQDGSVKQQLRIVLCPQGNEENQKSVFVHMYGVQLKSFRSAWIDAGQTDLMPGDTFTATYNGVEPVDDSSNAKMAKCFTYNIVHFNQNKDKESSQSNNSSSRKNNGVKK